MHMRIRYHFLADLHVTIQARETESEKHIQILQTNLLEFNLLQAEIVIIDPIPYQSTHFYISFTLRIHQWICPGKAKHRQILLNSIISRGEK